MICMLIACDSCLMLVALDLSYRSKAILCACLKGQPPAKERLVTRDGIAPILFFEARHSLVALVGELAVDR